MTIVINEEDKPLHKEQSQSEEEGRCAMETQDRSKKHEDGLNALLNMAAYFGRRGGIPKMESTHIDEVTGEKVTTKRSARGIYHIGCTVVCID